MNFLSGTHFKNLLCVGVVNLHIDISQEVLQLLKGHHVVFVLVCFPHAVDDPAGI